MLIRSGGVNAEVLSLAHFSKGGLSSSVRGYIGHLHDPREAGASGCLPDRWGVSEGQKRNGAFGLPARVGERGAGNGQAEKRSGVVAEESSPGSLGGGAQVCDVLRPGRRGTQKLAVLRDGGGLAVIRMTRLEQAAFGEFEDFMRDIIAGWLRVFGFPARLVATETPRCLLALGVMVVRRRAEIKPGTVLPWCRVQSASAARRRRKLWVPPETESPLSFTPAPHSQATCARIVPSSPGAGINAIPSSATRAKTFEDIGREAQTGFRAWNGRVTCQNLLDLLVESIPGSDIHSAPRPLESTVPSR
jgi:hypothetical protein